MTIKQPTYIVLPQTIATHFVPNHTVNQLLPSFYKLERELYLHIKEFLEICSTFRFQNSNDESIRIRMFPFLLKNKVKVWLNSLPAEYITTWDELSTSSSPSFFLCKKQMPLGER